MTCWGRGREEQYGRRTRVGGWVDMTHLEGVGLRRYGEKMKIERENWFRRRIF